VDRPRGSWGRGAALDVLEVITDRPRQGAGPSKRLADCPWGRRGLSARAACRWVPGRGMKIKLDLSLLYPDPRLIPLSFSLSLKEKAPHLGTFDSSTPRTVRAHPQTLRVVLHHIIRVFFRISHSISQILSNKVIRVWRCDLNFVHGFKFLA
jgi:hypothetical protein